MTGAAIVQQLLYPIKPSLPIVSASLPSSVSSLDLRLVSREPMGKSIGRERQYIAGGSYRYLSNNSDQLILTPLSSWMNVSLNPLSISSHLSGNQQLTKAKILTIIPNQLQIAIGTLGRSHAYQGCLTQHGQVMIDRLAAPKPRFLRKTLNTVWPSTLYSFSCVLITTNQRSLLDGSTTSKEFLETLGDNIVWPE